MLSSIELEQIVRAVIQRLAAGRELMEGVAAVAGTSDTAGELALSESLITTHCVEGRLAGMSTLRVPSRAVVTPAVVDLLRAKKIQLVRGSSDGHPVTGHSAGHSPSSQHRPPVCVCGSAHWFASLGRHLCPKQACVEACSDDQAAQAIMKHFAIGGRRAVWITGRPFAAAAQSHQHPQWVAVHLASLVELSAAVEQARPNLIIVDAQRWTVAAIGNLVRSLVRLGG